MSMDGKHQGLWGSGGLRIRLSAVRARLSDCTVILVRDGRQMSIAVDVSLVYAVRILGMLVCLMGRVDATTTTPLINASNHAFEIAS